MNALEINNLSKSFGKTKVIDDLSFSVKSNSIFGFIGENGAGKTTTMKMVLGLLKADGGEINVFGETVTYGQTKTNSLIGYLPDVPEFYSFMTAKEYLKLCGEITGLSNNKIKERTDELLALVGLQDNKKRIVGYSRGMKQRLGIAQALLNQPKLLICDEPTSALDPIGRKEILDILLKIKDKTTVIFSTHILSDVERVCDNIALLNNGHITMEGSLEEIKANSAQNSLFVEFESNNDLLAFMADNLIANNLKDYEIQNNCVIFNVLDTKKVQLDFIAVFYKNNIAPVKFEILEPTLENIFMEAIK